MTSHRFVSRFTALSSVLTGALVALRRRGMAPPASREEASRSQSASGSRRSGTEEADHGPTWPPPDGTYWGM